ncbi:putative toxin-antitoxin system toxin component, PIN family [Candidatus Woesearchaeota archaeon]|nr:putative toxin-antitoxin system toxin component, PIN family [Candidatus Woesearchaeota archaeon]
MKSGLPGNPRVVLDTNTVISAAISDDGTSYKVFELLLTGAIENITTKEIIAEVKDVFSRPRISKLIGPEDMNSFIQTFEKSSIKIEAISEFEAVPEDPDDNMILEAAVDGNADYILSWDNHLLQIGNFKGIKIITPKDFLLLFATN